MLNTAKLKDDIKNLLSEMETKETDSKEYFASTLANILEAYIKSAKLTITIDEGKVVVVGDASTQNNLSPIIITNDNAIS